MTHRLMHEHVGKRAKMQRSKESQMRGPKQARQAYQQRTEWRRCKPSTPTSKQTLGGMDVTTRAQAHEGHKAWQCLDLERLTWR